MKLIVNTLDHFEKTDGIVEKYIPEYYSRLTFDIDKKVNDGAFVSISFDDEVSIMSLLKLLTISRVSFILVTIETDASSRLSKKNMELIDGYLKICNYEKIDIQSDNILCYGMMHRGLIYNG